MKNKKREFGLSSLKDIVEYYSDEPYLKVRVTNYSTKIETYEETIFFSDEKPDKKVFQFYRKMESDIQGEIRPVPKFFKYYSFEGLKKAPENLYCVDINSAYLTVLKNENVISENTFSYIQKFSKGEGKPARLKSVGMFAKNPMEIIYNRGKVYSMKSLRSPYEWVFFLAVEKTFQAMESIKKKIGSDFIFYWVDGIFTRGNPEKIVFELKKLGFESKIEKIEKFHHEKGLITFLKDGKEKMLFLPKDQKEEKIQLINKIEKEL